MNKKKNMRPVIIIGAIMCAAGAGGIITAFILGNGIVGLFSFIAVLTGLILLITAAAESSTAKAASANAANPSTLCHKTYGGGGEYVYFPAFPNRKGQAARNAAVNAFGAVTMLFGGGVFVTGIDSVDVFVSKREIVINNRAKNKKLEDSKFRVIPADALDCVSFETDKKYERVLLGFKDGGLFSLDIPSAGGQNRESVRAAFGMLTPPKEADGAVTAI